jgi:hypothetical protein
LERAGGLILDSLEGETLQHDAFQLLGFSKLTTLRQLGHRLEVSRAFLGSAGPD